MTVETTRLSGARVTRRTTRSFSLARALLLLAVLATSVGVGYLGYQRLFPAPPPPPIVVPVRTGTIVSTVSTSGTLTATRQAQLTFGVTGELAEFTVDLGDLVTAGQVLARLESRHLEQQLAQAEANLRVNQLKLEQLTAGANPDELAAAQASYDSAVAKLEELQSGASAADLRAAESAVETAAAALSAARASLAQLEAGPLPEDLAAAEQAVASAEATLVQAQTTYDKLARGADPEEVLAAERALQQAKNSLWSTQIQRDATCGRDQGTSCQSANAQVASQEIAVQEAADKLARVQAGPTPEEVAQAERTLQGARSALAAAQARLDDLRNGPAAHEIEQARAAVVKAEADHQQAVANLDALRAGPKAEEIQAAEAQVASARAALNELLDGASAVDLASAELAVDQAELAVEQARLDLENATLVAPFDGIVAAIQGNVGEVANEAFITVVDPTALRVDVAVDESDVAKLQAGQPVQITFDSRPELTLTGKVSAVSPLGVSQQGVVTYPVAIALDEVPAGLHAGITATASIVIAQRDDVLVVPNRAVRTVGRNRVVTVMNGDQVEDRIVEVGLSDDQMTEIISGLNEGDLVVLPSTTPRQPDVGGFVGGFRAAPGRAVVPAGGPR